MKQLFQYAVILHKYDKENNYEDSQIIIEPKTELADNEKALVFRITREIPEEHATDPDNIQILVRNF